MGLCDYDQEIMTDHLIHPNELTSFLDSNPQAVLIDVRGMGKGLDSFCSGHLQNALFFDLEEDLSDVNVNPEIGGRHPLPSLENFYKTLAKKGIEAHQDVVIYDNASGALGAARLWWMLKSIGHQSIRLLDGGLQKAVELGFEIVQGTPTYHPIKSYGKMVNNWLLPLASFEEVTLKTVEVKTILIDVRGANRFEGIEEPIDPKAGHIPSAINHPFQQHLNPDGTFKSREELKSLYQKLKTNPAIFYCGSGVSACHGIFVFSMIGLPIPALFVGSWSLWCRRF